MDREARRNAFLYCKLRDEQFALYDEYAKRHGMPMNTLLVVNALYYAREGLTQAEICSRVFRSKQTVSIIVGNLLADGYVTVTETAENRRSKLVRMTEAGRAWCGGVVRHITRAEDTAMSLLSSEEQTRLIELSRIFTRRLEALIRAENEETEV